MCIYRKGIYYKELAHVIMEATEPEICSVGWQVETQES